MSTTRSVALVTGASAGIGRAFATELTRRGYDVVLVARDADRLTELGRELATLGGTPEVLAADLVEPAELARVEARLADAARPVDLLVNNAGFGTVGPFVTLDPAGEEREIRLNVVAVSRLTRAVLPQLVERGAGGVINVSSIAGYQPTPGNATYGATKAFVTSFSQAVHEELKGTGVRCMVLSPGFTRTEFQTRAGIDSSAVPGFMWQSPEVVVGHALRAFDRGRATCVPGAMNLTTAAFTQVMPHGVTRRIAGIVVDRTER
jgi:short-subunit dehydrogenase